MIELIIAMVLLAIVFAAGSTMLMRMFSGSNVAGENQRLFTQFEQTREVLTQDIRTARAPGRTLDVIRDRDEFAREIRTGNSRLPRSLDIQDVKQATGQTFAFVADVYSNPHDASWNGPECVWWQLTSAQGKWSVKRSVAPYRGSCATSPPASAIQASWVRSIDAGNTRAPTSLFRYVLACDPSACAGGAGCATTSTTSGPVTGLRRGWITEVRIDLSAVAVRGTAAARDRLSANIALRNRLSNDYQYALGCVQR